MINMIIIDDEPKVRSGLERVFKSRYDKELEINTFSTALEALEYLKTNPADIIITDIKMPKMNGLDMIGKIREENNDVEIIILSGYSYFEYAQKAIELNVRKYLTKPTNTRELFSIVDSIKNELDIIIEDEFDFIDHSPSNLIIFKAIEYLENNYSKKISLKEISEELFVSPNYLSRLFKREMDINLFDYLQKIRLEEAKKLLDNLNYKVYEISEMVGYGDTKYFSNIFKKIHGYTPMEYRNRNR